MIRRPPRSTLFPYTTLFRSPMTATVEEARDLVAAASDRGVTLQVGHIERFNAAFRATQGDRKSTRLNSSHLVISYAVFCLKKKKKGRSCTSGSLASTPSETA